MFDGGKHFIEASEFFDRVDVVLTDGEVWGWESEMGHQ